MMRNFLLAIVLLFSSVVYAKDVERVAGVDFGCTYENALDNLKVQWGEPEMCDANSIVYLYKLYEDLDFDKIIFDFQRDTVSSYLNQARFYSVSKSKADAIRKMKSLAEKLGEEYSVSYDEEDNHTPFYKGGWSSVGMRPLFTLFVERVEGQWNCILRYGAFPFIK